MAYSRSTSIVVANRDPLRGVNIPILDFGDQLVRRLFELADRRCAVGKRRVARNAAEFQDQPVARRRNSTNVSSTNAGLPAFMRCERMSFCIVTKSSGWLAFVFGAEHTVQPLDPLVRPDRCERALPGRPETCAAPADTPCRDRCRGDGRSSRRQPFSSMSVARPRSAKIRSICSTICAMRVESLRRMTLDQPRCLGRHLVETRDALAAEVDLAGIARVVDLDPRVAQRVIHADDLGPEQGKDALAAGTLNEIAVDLVVVVVADAEGGDALLRRQIRPPARRFQKRRSSAADECGRSRAAAVAERNPVAPAHASRPAFQVGATHQALRRLVGPLSVLPREVSLFAHRIPCLRLTEAWLHPARHFKVNQMSEARLRRRNHGARPLTLGCKLGQ